MKKYAYLILFAFLSFQAFSQTGNSFKKHLKKQSGASNTGLSYTTISNTSGNKLGLRASSKGIFHVSKSLNYPNLKKDTVKSFQFKPGVPIYIEQEKPNLKSAKAQSTKDQFYSFHNLAKERTGIKNPMEELVIKHSSTDNLGITHLKSQQYFKGVKVYGAESILHLGSRKDVFTGYIYTVDPGLNVQPGVSEKEALDVVQTDLSSRTIVKTLTRKEKDFLNYESATISLVVFDNLLAYEIIFRPNFIEEWKYFINAQTSGVIMSFNNTKSDGPATATASDLNNVLRTVDTYLEDGSYVLLNAAETMFNAATNEGIVFTLDANNTSTENLDYSTITSADNTWDHKAAISAHYSATRTYEYLENTFNRNSINDQGGNIISFVNVANEDGSSMENAFWNGKAAFYGNGGSAFLPLAGALDVVAHELGHGVVSNTANLEYYGQSGAINETYADIFGSMVDRDDWLIGEDVTKTSFSPSGALRNMSDPHNQGSSLNDSYWQPRHVSEMYIGEGDNGGVHINSGIGNYAYYLYATAVTKEKAEQVFYRALANYLTSKSQFTDFRVAVVQSAKDLYGESSQEAEEAKKAFDAVGINEEEIVDYEQDYDVNTGDEYLLSYDTDPANSNTLYRSAADGTDFYELTTTEMKGRVSVSDDGTALVFVATDDRIKVLGTDPENITEFYLSDEAFFDNVALSKDGNRLAAISTEIDTAIYIYDFVSEQWLKYTLYNPTTSHSGTDAGGVVYADAIEFDHSGEYLVYDAYNILNSTSGEDISYWDIGFIKVWDNEKNSFGDGTINKLYGSLPENVSIGNPTFSKNSPYIIAFDYFNSLDDEYGIFGANLLTGDLEVIVSNVIIGYPSFSNSDDKIAFSGLNTDDLEVVGIVDLEANKIKGKGTATVLVEDAQWPVFYTVGSRSLDLKPVANFTVDIKSGRPPLSVRFLDLSQNDPSSWSWAFEGGSPATSNQQNPTVSYNALGLYKVSLTCSNAAGNNTITKARYILVSNNTTSVNETINELFAYFPNPTNNYLNIETDKEYKLKLFSSSGNLLKYVENESVIDLSDLESGLYIIQVEIDGELITDKIIKR